jgi:leucyl-tRNA synthetase
VLADEQVEDGRCERCGTEVVPRELTQWFFKTTDYADRLLAGLATLDWPEVSKLRQTNWIGRSEGAIIRFPVAGTGDAIPCFTTRPDTVWGATFMVLAPEHPLVAKITTEDRKAEVDAYAERARRETEIERLSTDAARPKTGVFTGAYASNPVTDERIPIWIADYVLMGYGTGAIMAVPGHDERDHAFARAFGLPIVEVIAGGGEIAESAWTGPGPLVHSGRFDGMDSDTAKSAIVDWLEERGSAQRQVTYRLRDWLISRQRYWGPPIPIVYCPRDGIVPVPEDQLPVVLPEIEDFRPTGTGRSPLAALASFHKTTCPLCGGPAERETDVSDNFLDSAWYFLRYPCTEWNDRPFDRTRIEQWLPVDMYFGGKEHVVRHHLYARFIAMVLHDLGHLPFEEPFAHLRLHGFVTKDGTRMSKSRGNVVNPDDYIARVGADAFRTYLLFMGPYDQDNDFSDKNLVGVTRFLDRHWRLAVDPVPPVGSGADLRPLHRFVKRVTDELDAYRYHTAIAALMEFSNWIGANRAELTADQRDEVLRTLTLMLAPFAPFLAEELWERLGGAYSVHQQSWPAYDPALVVEETVTLVVQVNGKVRDRLTLPRGASEAEAQARALMSARVAPHLDGKSVGKTVWVPDKLINLVTG